MGSRSGLVTQASHCPAVLMALSGCQKGEGWKELVTKVTKPGHPTCISHNSSDFYTSSTQNSRLKSTPVSSQPLIL